MMLESAVHLVRASNSVDCLHEQSVKIALAYLAGVGELESPQQAFEFIGAHIAQQMHDGQQSHLVLSNKAIAAYQRHKADDVYHLVD